MDAYSGRRDGIRFSGYYPAGGVESIPIPLIVQRYKVHYHKILRRQLQSDHLHLKGGKHSPAGLGDNHLRPLLVEFVPQMLPLEHHHYGG